jgi:hypothetical protein
MHARWNQAQPTHAAPRPLRKTSWLPRIAGLLAFCALAFGVLLAGSETCTAHEAAGTGSYSRSTLSLITGSHADAAARHRSGSGSSSCRHQHTAARPAHPKAVP